MIPPGEQSPLPVLAGIGRGLFIMYKNRGKTGR